MFAKGCKNLEKSVLIRRKPMQLSIYCKKEDKDLIEKIAIAAKAQRKSKGALILSILYDYLQQRRKLGAILLSINALSKGQLSQALGLQRKNKEKRLLGEILLELGYIEEKTLKESLALQKTKTEWLTKQPVV